MFGIGVINGSMNESRSINVRFEIQGGEVIVHRFFPSYQIDGSVCPEQEFFGAQPAVVIESHGVTMGPGVVNHQDVAIVDNGKGSLDGKFVVVFAE